jgi:hypothetical protein
MRVTLVRVLLLVLNPFSLLKKLAKLLANYLLERY